MKLIFKVILSVAICLFLGGLSGYATVSEIKNWYLQLNKPTFNPPNWLFGPAWSTLYTFMGISIALIWDRLDKAKIKIFTSKAVIFFIIQFFLNLAWSSIFFSLHLVAFALIEMLILWVFILLTIIQFYRINKIAGILLVPYILWVSFATVLTASILYLNS
jgi:tryptophan-rich sensory protein